MNSFKFPNNLSKVLDRAVTRLQNGESIKSIVASSPASLRAQLSEFLPIVAELRGISLVEVPTANRHYLFLNHTIEKVSGLTKFMRTLRTGYAISGAFVLLLIVGISTVAAKSLPGSPLFGLKKTWEIAQIKVVARTPGDRAQLELTLADKRLAEAQQVFSDQSSDASDKAQAVQELDSQTQVALNQIQQVAATPAVTSNPGIIKNLVALTKNQASLQAQVNPVAANNSTAKNQKALAAIQQTVDTATSAQSSAQIASQTQAQTTGVIIAITNSSFTVDKNVFQIDDKTQFLAADGSTLKQSSFGVGDVITVIGITAGENNQAQVVTMKTKAVSAQPATTTPATQTTSGTDTTDATSSPSDTGSSSIPVSVQPTAPDVNGGFILESPAPQ